MIAIGQRSDRGQDDRTTRRPHDTTTGHNDDGEPADTPPARRGARADGEPDDTTTRRSDRGIRRCIIRRSDRGIQRGSDDPTASRPRRRRAGRRAARTPRRARADRGRPVLLSRQRLYQLAVLLYH
nr:MAG: hypothetical protein AmFV_00216 [Apis mellifera filamentous virus]